MKTILFNAPANNLTGASKITTVLIGVLLIGLASCTKKEDGGLTNIPSSRNDVSQAQVLEAYDLDKGATLTDRVNGVDYLILSNLKVNSGRLIIKPGVTIMFEDGAGLEISEGGSLSAIGESGNEIYFISKSGKRGDWQGVTVLSNSAANVLSYCRIEHAGSSLNANGQADIIVGNGSMTGAIQINHNVITTSAATGVLIHEGSEVRDFTDNTITANTTYPVSMNIAYARNLPEGNTFTDNGKEFIELTGSGDNSIQTPSVIHNLNEPYALTGTINMGTNLTVAAGVQLRMNSGAQLNIDGQTNAGSLSAVGSAAQPITITGVYNNAGEWNAINFKSSYSALNQLEYCNISGGGAAVQDFHGMINLECFGDKQSQVIMRNCSISNSSAKGMYVQKSAIYNADIESVNTFSNNAGGNIYYDVH